MDPEEQSTERMVCSIVYGHIIAIERPWEAVNNMNFLVEHAVDSSLRHHPLTKDEPLIPQASVILLQICDIVWI